MATKTKSKTEVCTDFAQFAKPVCARFKEMSKHELFVTDCGDALFDQYLKAFPAGTNPMLRERTVHDCVTCRQFIKRLGKLVNIQNGKVTTVWGGLDLPHPYKEVADTLDELVKCASIVTVFRTKEKSYGQDHNYDPKTNERYDHFHGEVAARHYGLDADTKRGEQEAIFQVAKRGLEQIKKADLMTVLDLIGSNGLYRGEEHRPAVVGFLELATMFEAAGRTDLFVWEHLDSRNAKFRNTVIGTLLVDLAEGMDLETAAEKFGKKVDPLNYKRPTAVITKKMVDDALAKLNELDLGGAVHRRMARISDVSVNDVLFADRDTKGKMKDGLASLLEGSVKQTLPDLKNAKKVTADEFVERLQTGVGATTLDLYLENRHQGNFVVLTGADGPERLFRWNNNFAWSYAGNTTDSVKQRVKAAGGKIDCKLRVSLSWFNTDDLDLHAFTPRGQHIYYGDKLGVLDVDMNVRGETRTPVENLAFNKLEDGVYKIVVNQYTRRETADIGFAIEVEFGGQLHQYSYAKSVAAKDNVECFRLHVKKGELVKIETELTGGTVSQDKWGVKTETMVPVAAVMFSPNHWGENAAGAKHLIFALKGCKCPEPVRGIYNEFLRPEFEKHRKVFEVLGNKTMCQPADDQVAGVGFTAARGDTVTVVLDGKRAYQLTF